MLFGFKLEFLTTWDSCYHLRSNLYKICIFKLNSLENVKNVASEISHGLNVTPVYFLTATLDFLVLKSLFQRSWNAGEWAVLRSQWKWGCCSRNDSSVLSPFVSPVEQPVVPCCQTPHGRLGGKNHTKRDWILWSKTSWRTASAICVESSPSSEQQKERESLQQGGKDLDLAEPCPRTSLPPPSQTSGLSWECFGEGTVSICFLCEGKNLGIKWGCI